MPKLNSGKLEKIVHPIKSSHFCFFLHSNNLLFQNPTDRSTANSIGFLSFDENANSLDHKADANKSMKHIAQIHLPYITPPKFLNFHAFFQAKVFALKFQIFLSMSFLNESTQCLIQLIVHSIVTILLSKFEILFSFQQILHRTN